MRPLIKYLFLLITLNAPALRAQDVPSRETVMKTDSLNLVFKNALNDTTRTNILVALVDQLYLYYPDTIIPLSLKALEIADKNFNHANDQEKHSYLISKAAALSNLGNKYGDEGDIPLALDYYVKSLKIQETIGDKLAIANLLNNIAFIWNYQGKVEKALNYWEKSLMLREVMGDKKGVANSLTNIGFVYHNQGNISRALEHYNRSLKIQEGIHDKEGMAYSLHNIAAIQQDQGDIEGAIKNFEKSLKFREEIGDKRGIGYSLKSIADLYNIKSNFSEALKYFEKSLKVREEIGELQGIAYSLNSLGTINLTLKNIPKALEYYHRALKLMRTLGNKQGMAASFNYLGSIYLKLGIKGNVSPAKQKNYLIAQKYLDSSLVLSKQLGFPVEIRNAEQFLSQIDSAKGNYSGAFEHYKQFIIYRDSINNQSTRKASIKSQLKYEYEKKEAVIKEQQEKERAISEEQNSRQQIIIWSVGCGLLFVIVFVAFVFRSLKTTREQKIIIEEKQKEILDSINYAKRIQMALIPSEKQIHQILKKLKTHEGK